jgi:hypothetical protein
VAPQGPERRRVSGASAYESARRQTPRFLPFHGHFELPKSCPSLTLELLEEPENSDFYSLGQEQCVVDIDTVADRFRLRTTKSGACGRSAIAASAPPAYHSVTVTSTRRD